jgi:HPt (histidine-containing phosphotransfer) domain-containing protein
VAFFLQVKHGWKACLLCKQLIRKNGLRLQQQDRHQEGNTMPQSHSNSDNHEIHLESEQPLLNDALLAQYEAMDEGAKDDPLLPKLFVIFQKNLPEHMDQLIEALGKQDETEVNYLIHKMLGMAHNVGALRLSDILTILEHAELPTKMRLNQEDLARIADEFKAAETALCDYMKSRAH